MPVEMEEIYRKIAPEKIPWNIETPPDILVRLVRNRRLVPCRTIEFGCGAGNYAVWLAKQGFDVTGIDISPSAIDLARENARREGVRCTFVVADVLGDLPEVKGPFDFAFDWELLHHIYPEDRPRYVANVARLLRPGARYLSVCFHENDPQFGGSGKYRTTQIGTVLYFSSEEELRHLFAPSFTILALRAVAIRGKWGDHVANCAFMEK
ncbi:MAG TPA: class I SAM-dependent methyltransferase [Methanoregulaceae archaeon]|nr:class I SAM-dependent methyltransferase [Methanoregulaceae archaeon]